MWEAGSDIRVATFAGCYQMTLDRISTVPFDTATVTRLGRITAETSGHLFDRQGDDLRTCLDTTLDVRKIACSPGKPWNIYWLTCRSKLPFGYAKLKYPSTLSGEPDRDADATAED